jgi:predicted N-acetyltransferase YhbS
VESAAQLSIRPAVAPDLLWLRRLAADAFDLEPIQRTRLVDLLADRPPDDPRLRIVAELDGMPVGFAFGAHHGTVGHIDAIAVADGHRRRGVGSALLAALETELQRGGIDTLQVGGNTWFYAWPGVDLGYTAALCLAERRGYTLQEQVQNMDVPLAAWVPGAGKPTSAVEVRRATPADWPHLERFITAQFSEVWRHEAELVVHRNPVTAFVALGNDDIVGFACHGVYRVDWFGPLAVDESQRGAGTGELLLRTCLDDLAAAGIATAQIGWIGPTHFYARTVGARLGRRFAVLSKPARPNGAA